MLIESVESAFGNRGGSAEFKTAFTLSCAMSSGATAVAAALLNGSRLVRFRTAILRFLGSPVRSSCLCVCRRSTVLQCIRYDEAAATVAPTIAAMASDNQAACVLEELSISRIQWQASLLPYLKETQNEMAPLLTSTTNASTQQHRTRHNNSILRY